MYTNDVYFTVFRRRDWFEYHVSADKQDVIDQMALSQRIPTDSDDADQMLDNWKYEARNLGMIYIETDHHL